MTATDYLNDLNQRYLSIHRKKEDLFWDTYMGLSDDHESSTRAQTKWTNFLSNSEQITAIKQQLDMVERIADPQEQQRTKTGLEGWLATFQSHAIESEEAQILKNKLITFEADLFEKKQKHVLTFIDENGKQVDGSLPTLGATIRTSEYETVRQSAHQVLLGLEQWLLHNGFIELREPLFSVDKLNRNAGECFFYSVEG